MAKNNQTKATLTPEQQAIATRAEAQDKLRRPIREDELNDFSLMKNVLDLPEAAQKLQDKKIYAFRWCERTPERIDFLTRSERPPMRWALVTRTTVSELEDLVDPMLGCVYVLDQALLYKYWEDHARVQKAKMELAEVGLQTGSLEGKKHQIENRDDDVEVFTGSKHRIGGSDEVMADESIIDSQAGIVDDSTPLGDLVVEQ